MLNMNFEMIDGVVLARLPDVYAPFTVPEGKVTIFQDQGSSTQLQRVSHKEYSAEFCSRGGGGAWGGLWGGPPLPRRRP